jgi:glycosyltransferase involved in cell wall biosynthesis
VFLGRLVSDKGADLLLEAIALFAPPRPTLTIIGSGPEQASLRHRVRDLQIADSVVFSGPLEGEALVRSLHAHQVMVIPSVWEEPFGMVALEGIACGCVVLASDGGGLPDAVGAAGLLFQRGDVESLHCNLQLLLKDPALRSELRAQAPAHLRNFQPKQVSSRYLDVLEHAVQSRKKGTL